MFSIVQSDLHCPIPDFDPEFGDEMVTPPNSLLLDTEIAFFDFNGGHPTDE